MKIDTKGINSRNQQLVLAVSESGSRRMFAGREKEKGERNVRLRKDKKLKLVGYALLFRAVSLARD